MSGTFTAFRQENGPTQFGDNKTPVTADVVIYGFVYAAIILAVSFFVVIPGVRGGKEKAFLFIRISTAIFVLASIMVCNFGQYWETGSVVSETAYRAGLKQNINASIGLHIGLRGVNITLKTDPVTQTFVDGLYNETIDYNERFSWDNEGFLQGRPGFGPYAGKFNQMYREGQLKGLPYPILWIAEYFTFDDEGLRWGRFYRQAGYFTHVLLWLALPLWLLTIIFFSIIIPYGCYFSILTGACLLTGNIVFAAIKNPFPLIIHFSDGQITMHYGWSFNLCLANGLICCFIGIIGLIVYKLAADAANTFFAIDSAHEVVQEFYETGDTIYGEKIEMEIPQVTAVPASNGGAHKTDRDLARRPPAKLPQHNGHADMGNSVLRPPARIPQHNGHADDATTSNSVHRPPAPLPQHAGASTSQQQQQAEGSSGVKHKPKNKQQQQQQRPIEDAPPPQTPPAGITSPDDVIYVNTIGSSERVTDDNADTTTRPRQQGNQNGGGRPRQQRNVDVIEEQETQFAVPAAPPLPSGPPPPPTRQPPSLPTKKRQL